MGTECSLHFRKEALLIYLFGTKKKKRPRVRLSAKRTNSLLQDANQSMTGLALSQTRQRDERHNIEHTRQGLGIATHAHPRNFSSTNARTRHPDLTIPPAVCLLEAWNPAIWRLKPTTSVCLPLISDGNHSNCCRNRVPPVTAATGCRKDGLRGLRHGSGCTGTQTEHSSQKGEAGG